MKRIEAKLLLSLLTLTTIPLATQVNKHQAINLYDNEKSLKDFNHKIETETDNPFIKKVEVNGIPTTQSLGGMVVDSKGVFYCSRGVYGFWISENGIDFKPLIENWPETKRIDHVVYNSETNLIYFSVYNENAYHELWVVNGSAHDYSKIELNLEKDEFIMSLAVTFDNRIFISTWSQNMINKDPFSTEFITLSNFNETSAGWNEIAIDKNTGTMYALGPHEVSVSKDNGKTWIDKVHWENGSGYSIIVDNSENVYYSKDTGAGKITVYRSVDGGDSFTEVKDIKDGSTSMLVDSSTGFIYSLIDYDYSSLYISVDGGDNFIKALDFSHDRTRGLQTSFDNNVYINTSGGYYKINFVKDFFSNLTEPDSPGNNYYSYVYNQEQNINIKDDYIQDAKLDGEKITIPGNEVPLKIGEHKLVLELKEEYKKHAEFIGGNNGTVTYSFWIKKNIDDLNVVFDVNNNDTELFMGLTSNLGNTNGTPIIQTKIKEETGDHQANLVIKNKDSLIDYDVNKTYFIKGSVDKNNNFTAAGEKKIIDDEIEIKENGIYYFHLTDKVGNIYDRYLELGETNWKLKGIFNDEGLNKLASDLNVKVQVTDPLEQQKALAWLKKYETNAKNEFKKTVEKLGKGFQISFSEINGYKDFLDPLVYDGSDIEENINYEELNSLITSLAKEKLENELSKLPTNLNVDITNVIDKTTVENYSTWILNYQKFIEQNKNNWIDETVDTVGRGFASEEQIQQIKEYAKQISFVNYLAAVTWTEDTSTDYISFIDMEQFKTDIRIWVNQNLPEIEQAYNNAIVSALENLELHGYSIEELMDGRTTPQTKDEINNFKDGISWHDWLQDQANSKYQSWQLSMGLGIGVPALVVLLTIITFGLWRYNAKYNPAGANKSWKPKNNKKSNKFKEQKIYFDGKEIEEDPVVFNEEL